MVQHKEHVMLDCYANPMDLVLCHAQLMEGLGMKPLEVLAIMANCVKQMEHALEVCIVNIFIQ